jgi:L-ascorbate metabolism protein UlaG (beta-lactamase superfamily)
MKRFLIFFLIISILVLGMAGCAAAATAQPTPTPMPPTPSPIPPTSTPSLQDVLGKIHWFGTSAFLYNGSKVIYFDPISLEGNLPKADLILVSHAHSDHWSVGDIEKIIGPNTTLIISPDIASSYAAAKSQLGIPATILAEGQTTEVNGVNIQAVAAYGDGHPHTNHGDGYIVGIDGIRFYHAGGTDVYPDMAKYNCDIAFVPVYSKDKAQAIAEILPAKMIILEHTSFYAAQAVATLFTQSMGAGKTFVAMHDGPNTP